MTIDFNDPEVKELLEARAKEIAESVVSENYVPVTEIEGLKNKNSELIGKLQKTKEKYNGLEENDVQELKRLKAAREHDKFVELVLAGKTQEAKALATEGAVNPFKEKLSEFEEQFTLAQTKIKEYESIVQEKESKLTNMQKRQYLRELTSSDDSFKRDYFDDFYQLNADKMAIDNETGKVYAVKDGKVVLDTNGEKVEYAAYYDKQKATNGLFWQGGSGSGKKDASGAYLGGDPLKWTSAQRSEFIQANGAGAFAKLLQDYKR